MRIHESDPTTAAKNREQGAWCSLLGGCLFAVAIVGLAVGCLGRMVVDSNKIGR